MEQPNTSMAVRNFSLPEPPVLRKAAHAVSYADIVSSILLASTMESPSTQRQYKELKTQRRFQTHRTGYSSRHTIYASPKLEIDVYLTRLPH